MELKKSHYIGIIVGAILLVISIFFSTTKYFLLILGLGLIIAAIPFVAGIIIENKRNAEKEEMFLEFSRNLVESVKAGNPISKSILNVKDKSYGALSPHVKKLANQISLGIPLRTALENFSKDIDNKTISRAITLIGEAEKAGGDIGGILESVAGAVSISDKLKKERKSIISTLVVQGYIIFFVFLIIILIMQFKIVPMISGITNVNEVSVSSQASVPTVGGSSAPDITSSFFYLILVQGFFSGLTIGKLSEGNLKAGVKHSFAMMLMAFIVSQGANLFV
jgi:flagellar protein FlaJ